MPALLTTLPRRLLPRLPVPELALWQSASKPRMPPTPSPMSTTWGGQSEVPSGGVCICMGGRRNGSKGAPQTPDLPTEASALCRAQEGGIGLVGAGNHGGHSALVAGRGRGQQGQGGQGNVVLGAGQAVSIMTVGAQAAEGECKAGEGVPSPPWPLHFP